MEPFAILVLVVLIGVFGFLVLTRYPPDIVLSIGLVAITLFSGDAFTINHAFSGLLNQGVLIIAFLYIVAAGIRETGAIFHLVNSFLGRPKSLLAAQLRMMIPIAAVSGFVNNTPLVAVLLPNILDWAKKIRQPVSKLLIPMSYAAILGGLCTLIGTSTNLLVFGELQKQNITMSFFEISKIGVPVALIGISYLAFAGRFLIPDRSPQTDKMADPREFTVEMVVEEGSPMVGKTIEGAGLRHLPGVYLIEIDRSSEVIPAVSPSEKLQAKDRLVFAGIVDSIVDLQKFPGLKPAPDQTFKLKGNGDRVLIEAVVSHQSPMIGGSIREGRFRTRYNAVVIAVARDGERLKKKIGDIFLRAGDVLIVEADQEFLIKHRNSRDFYLMSRIEGYTPPRFEKSWLALTIVVILLLLVITGTIPMIKGAMVAAIAMVLTRCLSLESARRSLDSSVLLAIVAALGIGSAIHESGLAELFANSVLSIVGSHPMMILLTLYLVTVFISELITNSAAAGLMINFAFALSAQTGMPILPLALTVMVASSAAFATPIGYQTNLMIYGPGGYRFKDFMRVGIPLDLIIAISATTLIYFLYF